MPGSTMSEYILYPITGFLKRGASTILQQAGDLHCFGFESEEKSHSLLTSAHSFNFINTLCWRTGMAQWRENSPRTNLTLVSGHMWVHFVVDSCA